MNSRDEHWDRKYSYLTDPNDEEMQRLLRGYLEQEAVRSGDKYQQLEALGRADPRIRSLVLGRHALVSAHHGYLCICPSCEIYLACSMTEVAWKNGNFGPFNPKELSRVRELLGYSPIPEKYWTANYARFTGDSPDHQLDRGEPLLPPHQT